MRNSLRVVLLALIYWLSVYFAILALEPALAAPIAWFAVLLAMLAFLLIDEAFRDEPNLPLALLFLFPFVCVTAGVIWWILRAAGLWKPIR